MGYFKQVFLLLVIVDYIYSIEQVEDPSIARPRKVVAEVEDANTIKLKWTSPRLAEQQNCPVKRYLIRLRTDGGKRSKTWKIDGARHSLTLHDLQESTLYYIRLMAVTCDGKGARTRWIKVRTGAYERVPDDGWDEEEDSTVEVRSPGKPTYVRTRTNSNSVILSWQPPEGEIIVRGYKVGYGEGVPDLNWRYVDASKRNVTIENLKPSTQYVISLCAFNNYGEGPPQYELTYTREINGQSQSPFTPPQNVRAKILSATTAWLQWSDPSLGTHQQVTDDRYYNVHYQALPNGKTLSLVVKALHVVLYDMTPGTTYAFKIRTVKDSHSSPFSDIVRNKTFETAPSSPPRQLTVLSTNDSTTVHLAWRVPRQPNGYITAYLVLYTTNQKQPVSTWDVFAVPGANTEVIMSTLKPNTTYYFKVQARNSQGYGPTSNTLVYRTSTMNTAKDGNDVFYEEDIDEDDVLEEDDYDGLMHDEYNALYDNGKFEKLVQATEKAQSDDNAIADSTANTRASANLKASSLALEGRDDSHYVEQNQLSPLDVSFQSVVKHTVSAVVTWKVPCYDEPKSPVKYMVRYYVADTPEIYTDKSTPTNFVLVDNLSPNKVYHYKVKRMSEDSEDSDWSKAGLLDTHYSIDES